MTAPACIEPAAEVPTIFVVDDDESVRRAIARLVRSEGWVVEAFESATRFLALAPFAGIGCVLLDVCMPGMTGPEAHAEMLARGLTLPVIFLTAHGELQTGVQAMKRGAVDFLTKPADEDTLLPVLREALARAQRQRAERRHRSEVGHRLARLSSRELEVMGLVMRGLLNKQIADQMSISIKTVKVHRACVMEKMEVRSVAALIHQCESIGLEPPGPTR